MRKIVLSVLVLALVAMAAPAALAGPTVSGYLETVIKYDIGKDEPYTFGEAYYRLNVSGDVGENLGYFSRIEGNSNLTPTIDQAYVTLKNLATPGLNVSIGAVSPWWSRTNNYGTAFGINDFTGLTASYTAGPVKVDGYYKVVKDYSSSKLDTIDAPRKLASNEEVGGKLGYSMEVGSISLAVDGLVQATLAEKSASGYGVSASVGVNTVGDAYVEYTKNVKDEVATVVGANITALKEATGVGAWVEYDVKNSEVAFEVSRDIVSGLNLAFGGSTEKGELGTYVKATASVTF